MADRGGSIAAVRDLRLPLLWMIPVAVTAIVGTLLSWFAYDDYRQTLEHEFRFLEAHARIGEAELSGLLRNVEQTLDRIADQHAALAPGGEAAFEAMLADRLRENPEVRSLVVIDAAGRVVLTANPFLRGFDSSRRDYFVAHLERPLDPAIYVSRPYKTSFGDPSIAFSVAMYDPAHHFRGAVVTGVDPKYFDGVLRRIRPDEAGGTAVLINRQGDILYRLPQPDRFNGTSVAAAAPFLEFTRSGERVTRYIGHAASDGVERLFVFNAVGRSSLTVVVTRPLDEVLSPWRRGLVARLAAFAAITAVTLGLAWLIQRRQRDLQLAASIFHASSEGMLVTDAKNRIVAINPAVTRMTGYTFDDLAGKDPQIFNSGRHGRDFFAAMWHEIETTGGWRGEIWDRNKDGEVVAKRLTIDTVPNFDGSVRRRIALFSDITEQKLAEETIWRQANFDALTALPNRRLFLDRLAQEMKKTHRTGQMLALLLIDLDQFKEVNDTRGHDVGDLLLSEAGRRIGGCVRDSDTVARLGGDEFGIALAGLADATRANQVAQAVLQALAAPFTLRDEDAYITASIGITLYPNDAVDIESLLKNVDQAMYGAKAAGRNGASYFVAAMQEAAQARQQMIRDLRNALAADQLEVYYQPIVDLLGGRIRKAEALVRWRHPDRGMISPALFIPLAEETGLIRDLGDWVFRQAADTAKRWHDLAGRPGAAQVTVNMSPRQFVGGDAQQAWLDYLERIDLPPGCVGIEITEGLLLDERADVTETLGRFQSLGMRISLDDFGTGYSAMAYLKKFSIDYLKVDQSFVRDMADDPGDQAIVEAIIVMAHKLGLLVIAEGVETARQHELLAAAGCDFGQGYLFARPMPAAEFEARLRAEADSAVE